jgi:hypothetical protein
MEYFVVLRQESKSDRGFVCIFIQTCHKIHIKRPSFFRETLYGWLLVSVVSGRPVIFLMLK